MATTINRRQTQSLVLTAYRIGLFTPSAFAQHSAKSGMVKCRLNQVAVHGESPVSSLKVANHSHIVFRTASLRVFVRDRHVSKRTAVQEQDLFPIYSSALDPVGVDSSSAIEVVLEAARFPKARNSSSSNRKKAACSCLPCTSPVEKSYGQRGLMISN